MAWETTPLEETTMADTTGAISSDLAAVIFGALLPNLTNQKDDNLSRGGVNEILHTLNMQAVNNVEQALQSGHAGINQNISTAQASTNQNLANSTLQLATSNLQGFSGTNATIAAAAADVSANINNTRQGISNDIRDALGVIDADLHGMSAQMDRSISGVRDELQRGNNMLLTQAHQAEMTAMRNQFDLIKGQGEIIAAIKDDGSKTRDLINHNLVADLERQLQQERASHGYRRTTDELIINNNNNNNNLMSSMQQQSQQQGQQQQIAALTSAVQLLTGHVNTLTQTSVIVGNRNSIAPTGVQS